VIWRVSPSLLDTARGSWVVVSILSFLLFTMLCISPGSYTSRSAREDPHSAVTFLKAYTNQRWQEEARILYGPAAIEKRRFGTATTSWLRCGMGVQHFVIRWRTSATGLLLFTV
jgi:hypothetical protein